jgi:hypothetical protein
MTNREQAERRARRLLRWYPKAWRDRYGEEFTELLIDDIGERPRSWSRTLDVARRGMSARVAPSPVIAGLVLLASVLACVWIGAYTVRAGDHAVQIACRTHCTPQVVFHLRQTLPRETPLWATASAVAIGLGGAALALAIYRSRRISV